MANLKVCIIAAAVGFCISFFAGIMNTVQFHVIFLRALFSAVLFFGLAFGADFLLKNKLDVTSATATSDAPSSEEPSETPPAESLAATPDSDSDIPETGFTDVPPPPTGEQKMHEITHEITADKISTDGKMDFKQQDPELLAKAIRTVLKED